jgi:pimeloyl-ACP methyl ester carboxylesterase
MVLFVGRDDAPSALLHDRRGVCDPPRSWVALVAKRRSSIHALFIVVLKMRRRRLLISGLGLGLSSAGLLLYFGKHSLPKERDEAAEERFRKAQDALFAQVSLHAAERYLEVRDPSLRLHVIECGSGDPVVFVHGGNSVAAGWAPLLARLQDRFHIYAPDRPGCGLTSPFSYLGVNLRAHGATLLARVLDGLAMERASIVGNSMGGYFALAFALAHPERVSKLVLLGEPAGSAPRPSMFHRLVGTRGVNTLLYSTVLAPGGDAASARKGLVRGKLVSNIDRLSEELLACMAAGAVLPGAVESWMTMVESAFSPSGMGIVFSESQLTWALRPELGRLKSPTLLLWGDKDPFGAPAFGEEMAKLMPHAVCEVIPNAGHLPWLDEPDLCARRTAAFLEDG